MSRGFLLDTNVPSEQTRPQPEPRLSSWFEAQPETSLFLSVITIGELRQGIVLRPEGKRRSELERWLQFALLPRFNGRVLPVTQRVTERWGVLNASRRLAGLPLEIADGLIAATALEHDLILVTHNVRDFAQIGLTLLNPWEL